MALRLDRKCSSTKSKPNSSFLFVFRLESAAMVAKSDIAATRLRYEQQVYNLQTELTSLQVTMRTNQSDAPFTYLISTLISAETMRTFQTRPRLIQAATGRCEEDDQGVAIEQWPSEQRFDEQRR